MKCQRVIGYHVPDACIGGPFAVMAINAAGRNVASVSGIQTEEHCIAKADDYAHQYGGPVELVGLARPCRAWAGMP